MQRPWGRSSGGCRGPSDHDGCSGKSVAGGPGWGSHANVASCVMKHICSFISDWPAVQQGLQCKQLDPPVLCLPGLQVPSGQEAASRGGGGK